MFDGVLNKVAYCSITERLSARPALLCLISWMSQCLMIIWPSLLYVLLISLYLCSFYLSLCLFFTCEVHKEVGTLLCPYANYPCVFFLVLQMQNVLGSNLFTPAMWYLISDFLKICLCDSVAQSRWCCANSVWNVHAYWHWYVCGGWIQVA